MENMVENCEEIFKAVEENNFDVRFFEVVTMIGLLEFRKMKCDYVVLECGIGGKLDATNVVDSPDVICSAIVSIGMDHMDVIGNDIEDIAREKAGVIKKDIPCVLGPTCQNLEGIRERIELVKPKEAIFVDK
jgi:dihydrofolate synthase/folylpolyglutamate synthase